MRFHNKNIVWALHPAQPSIDGGCHSRGRKRHLEKDEKFTLCNMINDGLFEEWEVNNGMCKNCLKELQIKEMK
jgi:hypothetical protein